MAYELQGWMVLKGLRELEGKGMLNDLNVQVLRNQLGFTGVSLSRLGRWLRRVWNRIW